MAFWPFWAKVYRLEGYYSQGVHFGHFGRECTVLLTSLAEEEQVRMNQQLEWLALQEAQLAQHRTKIDE